jgi:hypothetical protein
LAAFFTALDVIHFKMALLSQGGEIRQLEEQQKARNDVLIAYRKILMRLNMSEPLHQELERSLEALLRVKDKTPNQEQVTRTVTLARKILKHEWEVTKYGPLTGPAIYFKNWWRLGVSSRKQV